MTCRVPCTCAALAAVSSAFAQPAPPKVSVIDRGAQTSVAGPGAPKHIIGLKRVTHTIVMDTGAKEYGLRYTVAHDKKRPGVAVPGEGYVGMDKPSGQNWYAGGFFDLQINGKTIGTIPLHSLTGRSAGNRGYVDFVFDTPLSIVRIRFVTIAERDALYCQALLEAKTEIKSLRLALRCYPSAFVSNTHRRVMTSIRELTQGERAELDVENEWWTLYYDGVYDAGYSGPRRRGVGPCSVLWRGNQANKVRFTVGGYGTSTVMDLKPNLRDFRFVFFDYTGTQNEAAIADLRQRADGLQRELAAFSFADQSVANWPLAQKQREIAQVLDATPDEEAASNYRKWAAELGERLKLVQSGAAGAIMAEADAAKIIQQWEKGLPELKLKALLRGI